jgi:ribonucleotide monophosphatase NagD (HAD superfamily)
MTKLEEAMGRYLTAEDAKNVKINMGILGLNVDQVGELRQALSSTMIGYDRDGVLDNISDSDKNISLAWYNLVASMLTDSGHEIPQQIVTNNPRTMPESMVGKMQSAGYDLSAENIATCGYATCQAMKAELDRRGLAPTVRVFGTPDLVQMAVNAGLRLDLNANGTIIGEMFPPNVPDQALTKQIVGTAMTTPVVMVTNPDRTMPYVQIDEGGNKESMIVDCVGKTILPLVERLTDAEVIGKPNFKFLEENINAGLTNFGIPEGNIDRYVFVGDTPSTDIAFANDAKGRIAGVDTQSVLVLTGNTSLHDVRHLRGNEMPDFIIRDFADMACVFGVAKEKVHAMEKEIARALKYSGDKDKGKDRCDIM